MFPGGIQHMKEQSLTMIWSGWVVCFLASSSSSHAFTMETNVPWRMSAHGWIGFNFSAILASHSACKPRIARRNDVTWASWRLKPTDCATVYATTPKFRIAGPLGGKPPVSDGKLSSRRDSNAESVPMPWHYQTYRSLNKLPKFCIPRKKRFVLRFVYLFLHMFFFQYV